VPVNALLLVLLGNEIDRPTMIWGVAFAATVGGVWAWNYSKLPFAFPNG
jgi:hypothetical protein